MSEYLVSAIELTKRMGIDPSAGLTDTQVKESAAKHGANALTRAKPESLLKRIWESATEPMVLLLIMAALIALGVNIFRGISSGEADYLEVVGIFVAISISIAITIIMEGRSAKAFEALSKINDDIVVKVLRNGSPVMLNQKDVVVGDVLLLATGDKIPADGRLLESTELAVDESALTGESNPVKKDAECVLTDEKTPLAERRNMLYSGTFITGGFCKLMVSAVGDKTEFGKIAGELGVTAKTTTPLQERLARMGKLITTFGFIAAAVVFISQLVSFALRGEFVMENIIEAFVISIVLIVATVPEGLPTIVAVSLSLNIIKLSREKALVKKIIASETVGCINVICSDKTGTLTENKMTVRALETKSGEIIDTVVLHNICVNSTANIGEGGMFIGNPTECALLTAAEKSGWNYQENRQSAQVVHTFPFSSEKKNMATIVREADGFIAYMKGSPEHIFRACGLDENTRKEIEGRLFAWQQKSCRIIAFAHRNFADQSALGDASNEDAIKSSMTFDGFAAIADPLRAEVFEAVNQCRIAGVDLKILTGDSLATATAIANELGVLNNGHIAVEAREIEPLPDAELSDMLKKISVIARSTPAIKMRVVNLLKAMGNVVAVTGDGINDAPALKNADVGIAMGISGTEVSKEASDIVLLDDSFSTIVRAVRWGRGIYENFKRFISFQLTVNVSAVVVVLTSILLGFKAPFTALELLWINIIMDGPPALALGLEPIHGDLMKRPPIKRSEDILSKPMLTRIGLVGLYISVVFLLQSTVNFLQVEAGQMRTVLFAMFALFQLFNTFNCRQLGAESICSNFFKNKLMLMVTAITFVLQVLIIQYAGAFFGTVPLPVDLWLKLFGVAFSVVAISELVKLPMRIRRKQ